MDNKEGFDMGGAHWADIDSPVFGVETPWPEELPSFRIFMEHYQGRMRQLPNRLMGLIGGALGLPDGYFEQTCSCPVDTLRLLHYYPHTDYQKGEIGAGAHTDYGGVTILLQGTGGLQVLNSVRNEWVHVPPTPGVFTVNL